MNTFLYELFHSILSILSFRYNLRSISYRCDRCDNYETINKTAFSAHQDQCLASGEAGESTEGIEGTENDGDGEEGHSGIRSHRKMFECDVCNMKFSNGANMRRHKVGRINIVRIYFSRYNISS